MALSTRHIEPLLIPSAAPSGITARQFDGVDDEIRVSIGSANITGAITMVMVLRKVRDGVQAIPLTSNTSSGGGVWNFLITADNRLSMGNGFNSAPAVTSPPPISASDGWVIVVAKKAAGTTSPRYHALINGVWWDGNASATLVDGSDQAGGTWRFGSFLGAVYYSFEIAAAAVFDRVVSDYEVHLFNRWSATRSFMDFSPAAAWEFDQSAVATPLDDLTGGGANETSRTGTAVISDGPPSWEYVPPLGSPAASGTFYTAAMALSPSLYWRLGESAGQAVTDISGNNHHGEYIGSADPGATSLLSGDSDGAMSVDQSEVGGARALNYKPFVPGSVRSFVCLLNQTLQNGAPTTFAGGNMQSPQTTVAGAGQTIPGTLTVADTTGADGSPAYPASSNYLRVQGSGLAGVNLTYTSKDATHFYGVSGATGTATNGGAVGYGAGGPHPTWEFIGSHLIRFYPSVDTFPGAWDDIDTGNDLNETIMFGVVYDDSTGLCDFWVNGAHIGQLGPNGVGSIPFAYAPGSARGVFQWGYRGDGSFYETFEGRADEILVFEYALDDADHLALATAAGFSADTTPPTPTILSGPTTSKISRVAGKDSFQFTWEADEDFAHYKIKVVPNGSSIHTDGTLIEEDENPSSGGTAGTDYTATITDDEVVAASGSDGSKVIKIFVQDDAGNWSL